jgi:hypothetical protein
VRALQRIDFGAYLRAFGLYARNPWLALAPLLMGLAGAIILMVAPPTPGTIGALSGGLAQLLVMLLDSFGLGVSLIIADGAWRRGRAPFDDAWDEARRKAGDILMAALGLNLVVWVAGIVGGFLTPIGAIVLTAVAAFFLIYTLPAAAIGGIPGAAALQVSVERVQRNYASTIVLALVFLLLMVLFPWVSNYIVLGLSSLSGIFATNAAIEIAEACLKAIGMGYLALVLAKTYADVSFGRRY